MHCGGCGHLAEAVDHHLRRGLRLVAAEGKGRDQIRAQALRPFAGPGQKFGYIGCDRRVIDGALAQTGRDAGDLESGVGDYFGEDLQLVVGHARIAATDQLANLDVVHAPLGG